MNYYKIKTNYNGNKLPGWVNLIQSRFVGLGLNLYRH